MQQQRMNLPLSEPDVRQPQVRTPVRTMDEGGTVFWRFCAWAALGLVVVAFGFLVDEPVTQLLTLAATSGWQRVANVASKMGEGWVIGFVGAFISGAMFLNRRFETGRGVFLIGFTSLITGLAATALR